LRLFQEKELESKFLKSDDGFYESVIGSAKFQEAEMELPIALGKTISNETFVVDLAKMPY
jgi:hypothetical protein